jgi:hypothetical protein
MLIWILIQKTKFDIHLQLIETDMILKVIYKLFNSDNFFDYDLKKKF